MQRHRRVVVYVRVYVCMCVCVCVAWSRLGSLQHAAKVGESGTQREAGQSNWRRAVVCCCCCSIRQQTRTALEASTQDSTTVHSYPADQHEAVVTWAASAGMREEGPGCTRTQARRRCSYRHRQARATRGMGVWSATHTGGRGPGRIGLHGGSRRASFWRGSGRRWMGWAVGSGR